ncbi:unnamed protein product, partial [Allacma fusca]
PPAKKSKRIKKGDVISYLQQKQEIETGIKKEELLLKKSVVGNNSSKRETGNGFQDQASGT